MAPPDKGEGEDWPQKRRAEDQSVGLTRGCHPQQAVAQAMDTGHSRVDAEDRLQAQSAVHALTSLIAPIVPSARQFSTTY